MKEADNKLDRITTIWNDYILESRFCQSRINFTNEVKTNYYGDIMNYLSDTFSLIAFNSKENSLQDEIYESTSVLQLIYVHQDLIEELLYIFKFDKDSLLANCQYRKSNRDIRNELVGHPIRREKKNQNKLISSVLYLPRPKIGKLEYVVYESDNEFKGNTKSFDKSEIISNHSKFLNKFFDLILDKLSLIITDYHKEHLNLMGMIESNKEFPQILQLLQSKFEYFLKYDEISTGSDLTELYNLRNQHLRFEYKLNTYLVDLEIMTIERILWMEEFLNIESDPNLEKRKEILLKPEKETSKNFRKRQNSYPYQLGKLAEKHPVFTINSFRRDFKDHDDIMEELDYMETNYENKIKYNSAWKLLYKLIGEKVNASH